MDSLDQQKSVRETNSEQSREQASKANKQANQHALIRERGLTYLQAFLARHVLRFRLFFAENSLYMYVRVEACKRGSRWSCVDKGGTGSKWVWVWGGVSTAAGV